MSHTVLVVCAILVATSSAQFVHIPLVHSVVAPRVVMSPVSVPTSSQYHAQDELGQFAFGHSTFNQAREEVKSLDGSVRGAYSYVDPNGKLINVQYLADELGFRVLGANNLPVAPVHTIEPVKDTPEVIAARAAFDVVFKEAKEGKPEEKEEEKKEEIKDRKRRDLSWSFYPYSSVVAKTTIKTSELKPVEDAKVPAATKLAEIKETEKEILTPLTYSAPIISSSLISPLISSPVTRPVFTKTVEPVFSSHIISPVITKTVTPVISSPVITKTVISSPVISKAVYPVLPISPVVAKTTLKTSEIKPVEDAKVPAATKLTEIKETEKEVLTPLTYATPFLRTSLFHPNIVSPHFIF